MPFDIKPIHFESSKRETQLKKLKLYITEIYVNKK